MSNRGLGILERFESQEFQVKNLIHNQEEGQTRKEDENLKPKRSRLDAFHSKASSLGF